MTKILIMHIVDNTITLSTNNSDKVINIKLSRNILDNGRIKKIKAFTDKLATILNENNLANNLLGNNIIVISNPFIDQTDTYVLKDILEQLSFNKITFIKEYELLELKSNTAWITMTDKYAYGIYINNLKRLDSLCINKKIYNDNLEKTIEQLLKVIKKPNYIMLSTLKNSDDLRTRLEHKMSKKIFIVENNEIYFIDKLKNTL